MARDHALALTVREGVGFVRFYRWERPTVSFGRNEPIGGDYRRAVEGAGFDAVRRPTGGRAVLHDRELTYAVVFPKRGLGRLREAYGRIHLGLVRGLAELGVRAESSNGRVLPPGAGPCFSAPAPGEVVVEGRKLMGSAQARIGDAVLQHGSLLLACDQTPLMALASGSGSGQPPAITLTEILGRLPLWSELVDALVSGLSSSLGPMSPGGRGRLVARTETSLQDRYASPGWTWRR